ncbi:MAG: Orotidine 5'-phosphate decarboxylase, partial [Parcubacteria group bacterium GW2011_GWA2_47_9]
MHKELLKYRLILPPQIEVMVHRAEEGGYWAKVLTFPGVVAQGEDLVDVIEMVNIAIFDYLGFDAVTLHPYLGKEALEPFLERKDKG